MVILVDSQGHLPACEGATLDVHPVHPSDDGSSNWHLITGHSEAPSEKCVAEPSQLPGSEERRCF